MLEAHDLLDVLDLLVLHDLVVLRLAHVEKLAAQREDPKVVTADDTEPGHGKRLGGISFGQYERALGRVARPGIVCVRELRDTGEAADDEKCDVEGNRRKGTHRLRLLPSVFLICWSALNFAQFNTFSTIEDLDTNADSTTVRLYFEERPYLSS